MVIKIFYSITEKHKIQELKRHPFRVKRAAGRNLIVFLQINENIGPLSIYKEQLDSLKSTYLYCDVDLFEDSQDGEDKINVYGNRIQKEIGEFDLGEEDTNSQDDYEFVLENSQPSIRLFKFPISICFISLFFVLLQFYNF